MSWRYVCKTLLIFLAAGLLGLAVSVWALSVLLGLVASSDGAEPLAEREPVAASAEAAPPFANSRVSQPPAAPGPAEPTLLAPLVSDGDLPPLAERLPDAPRVMGDPDSAEAARYGGTWLRLASAENDVGIISNRLSLMTPLRFTPGLETAVPHLAERVEADADLKRFTIHLRPGHRWSDGVPFTSADILYWWESELMDPQVGGGRAPTWLIHHGQSATLEADGPHRVVVTFDQPHGLFTDTLATIDTYNFANSPAHYLRPLHPTLGDAALIDATMQRWRQPNRNALYNAAKRWNNPDHPRLWPWIYAKARTSSPHVFVRNPYYFAVDALGRQLPYIDRVQFDVQSAQLIPLSATNGAVSMQARHLKFDKFTDLMTRRDAGGYDVYQWKSGSGSSWVINPNLNRRVVAADPGSAAKAELLGKAEFRQALSLALDRSRIVAAEYSGKAEPAQVTPPQGSPFYNAALAHAFIEHDPSRAEAMLDELGLHRPGPNRMRRTPDGELLTFYIDYSPFTGPGPIEFVVDDWAKVGIRVIPRSRARSLFTLSLQGGTSDFMIWTSESEWNPLLSPRHFVPTSESSFWAVGWGRWYESGGLRDSEAGVAGGGSGGEGGVAPPPGHPVLDAMRLFDQISVTADRAEQRALFDEIAAIAAEQLWTINLATAPPQVVVVDRDLRNVPRVAVDGNAFGSPGHTGMETWYFASRENSSGAVAEAREALRRLTATVDSTGAFLPGVDRVDVSGGGGVWFGRLLKYGFALAGVLLILLIALRHPFIGRRLLIMVPTLLILSVVIFTIIQLPPGDYLTARIAQLEASGDPTAERQIEQLRDLYRFEDPVWRRYVRWVGLEWFVSFDAADRGLIQGDMGRSMETDRPVSEMIGDRLLLTVLIALGTILLTWCLAIPIGIFSAVKQYSPADYVVTVVSFLGMCVPPFLLALVLMALAGASGLFSPEYAAQPEWTTGKVIDLLKHIWIPIVVLGLGGTGGMIRVMRANMLDELRKPYVVTARAKGVRPLKLLLKYPLRIAVNPFISRVGSLFPQLISGGAIVAIVLSLPTIGPLMLGALFNEDMYLAGSLLMLLSLLGIIGTLVSDLLLLLLDPRIRFEGGSR